MKSLRFLKTVGYLVFCAVLAANAAIVPAEQVGATTVYNLVDKDHGPRIGNEGQFINYFIIEYDPRIGNEGGEIDIASRDGDGKVIANHRFEWRFNRNASYLSDDPNNNLKIQMRITGTGETNTNHFMIAASGWSISNNFWNIDSAQFNDTSVTPHERVYENKGWQEREYHVRQDDHRKYAAIGFDIYLWSPADGGQAAVYRVCYLYDSVPDGAEGGDDDDNKDCSGISGEWEGSWSETSCNGEDYSGQWSGTVSINCAFTWTNEWDTVSGTINPSTMELTATGESQYECRSINMTGTFSGDSVSGSYTYSAGGSGTFSSDGGGTVNPEGDPEDGNQTTTSSSGGGGGGCFIQSLF